MSNQPLVSIITPTYNRSHTLYECIKSVLKQSYTHFELLIIDDGSIDDTAKFVEKIIEIFQETRIQFFQLEHTGDLSYLRNFGVMKAKGEFITFIDSDDSWLPYKLEIQVVQFKLYPESQWAFCDVIEFNNDHILREGIYQRLQRENGTYQELFQDLISGKLIIFPSTVMMKLDCIGAVGLFNPELKASDQEFLIRLAAHAPPLFLNDRLTLIRKHDSNMSIEKIYQEAGHLELLSALNWAKEKRLISSHLFKQRMAIILYGLGKIHTRANELAKADDYFAQAMHYTTTPLKLRLKIALKRLHIHLSDR